MEGDQEELLALYAEDPEGEERTLDEGKEAEEMNSILDQKHGKLDDEETQNESSDVSASNPVTHTIARIHSEFVDRKEQDEKIRYLNAGGNFFTGVDVDSKEAAERRILRAKRFGIDQSTKTLQPQLDKLQQRAKKFGIVSAEELAPFPPLPTEGEIRLEAVHLHGTNEMSNKDVLDYFKAYGPRNVEWINDSSCNVVWDDPQSASRALNQLGKDTPISMETGEGVKEEKEGSSAPVLRWRVGVPHPRASQIFLRYATTVDKKQVGAARESQYYKKYGNPNKRFTGMHQRRPRPDLRKRLGHKRKAGSTEPEDDDNMRAEEEEVEEEEEEEEEPMEVESALPPSKKPKTLYSDIEEVKSAIPAKAEKEEEEKGDLRKRIQRKRIQRGNLKMRIGPANASQNVD